EIKDQRTSLRGGFRSNPNPGFAGFNAAGRESDIRSFSEGGPRACNLGKIGRLMSAVGWAITDVLFNLGLGGINDLVLVTLRRLRGVPIAILKGCVIPIGVRSTRLLARHFRPLRWPGFEIIPAACQDERKDDDGCQSLHLDPPNTRFFLNRRIAISRPKAGIK